MNINEHLQELKEKIDNLIDCDQVECDDVFDHDYCNAPIIIGNIMPFLLMRHLSTQRVTTT